MANIGCLQHNSVMCLRKLQSHVALLLMGKRGKSTYIDSTANLETFMQNDRKKKK